MGNNNNSKEQVYSRQGDKFIRTLPQNKAMHLYFRMLAEAFNDAGKDIEMILTKPLNYPWSETLVKELIWQKVQSAVCDVESTTRLGTAQVSEIYEIINRYTAQEHGISVRFPNKER